jgi:chromosome segregation ATPase
VFSLAFLDVVSCGFGAIIILLIISQTSEPRGPEDRIADFSTEITRTQRELDAIRDEIGELRQLVDGEQRETFTLREEKQTLQQRFAHTEDAIDDTALELTATTRLSQNLAMVKQSLSEEMRRLQAVVEQPWV